MDSLKLASCDIINALRNQIVSLGEPENRENLERFIIPDESGRKDNVFVRRSPLSLPMLITFIMRHNPLSTQLSIEEFFDSIDRQPVTKSAMSQRRTRLDSELFAYLNKTFVERTYSLIKEHAGSWHGWHLLAADGSDISLPDTDAVAEYFGRYRYTSNNGQSSETFPMAKALMINDVTTGISLCGSLHPHNTDERKILEELLPELMSVCPYELPKTILILDRGYFSLKLFNTLDKAGLKFVTRITQSSNVINKFIESGASETVVDWRPGVNTSLRNDPEWRASGQKTLRVRLVRVNLSSGEVEVLATNLTDKEVGADMMGELYFMRWSIEVEYLHYKYAYLLESFSGGRPICIKQDYFATILVHNMVRLLAFISEDDVSNGNKHRKLEYKSNTAILVGVFYAVFVKMMVFDEVHNYVDIICHTAQKALTPIRKGRSFSRYRVRHKSADINLPRTNRKRVH